LSSKEAASSRTAHKYWFDESAAEALAGQVGSVYAGFDHAQFVRLATRDLESLEFAARVQQFSDALAATLPGVVPEALAILRRSLPDPLPDCEAVTDGWLQWPVGQFIADHGLNDFDESMETMIELTQRFSSEFAVRPFVEQHPDRTIARLLALTGHVSPHVRRWCSEGVRSRLPWGKKLRALATDPTPIWPILEALKDDPELYVRRSVANNLNDIARDHPSHVIARCRSWAKDADEQRAWTIKHGLRSLIKSGNPDALAVVGFGPPKGLNATLQVEPNRITTGDSVTLTARLESTHSKAQDVMVDYAVHYVRSAGKRSDKVFKWKTARVAPGEPLDLTKRHPMRATTVRALYQGEHRVELQVNGVRIAEASFRLD